MEQIQAKGKKFTDSRGGEVLLHGLNLVSKSRDEGYLPQCGEEDFRWMAQQGFNLLRLGVQWDGAEPEPCRFDRAYLARLRSLAETAGKYGLSVMLDMHQDLYSVRFADGAPEWATMTDGLPHVTGEVWSDAYLYSPAVSRALDHFWADDPAPDGKGLQEHFAAMWRETADAFRGCENLLGFDFFNEPFPGGSGQQALACMLETAARETGYSEETLMEILSKREELLRLLSDRTLFEKIVAAARGVCAAFEREKLQPMYQRVYDNLPEWAHGKIAMMESCYFSNMGVESAVERLENAPLQGYAPHGYDLTVDTSMDNAYSPERVRAIFAAHRRVQERLNLPVLVGEWGAFYGNPSDEPAARQTARIFEQYGWSDAYWAWVPSMRGQDCMEGLRRGYPQRVGGSLREYRWTREDGFWMRYQSDGTPCRIYLPGKGVLEIARPAGEAEIRIAD